MPGSKHRKRQIAANRKQLEKARKKLLLQSLRAQENEKENQSPRREEVLNRRDGNGMANNSSEEESSWFSGLGYLYSWCQSGLIQSVETAKDAVFPSRPLKRQLDDAHTRLREMEEELNMIRDTAKRRKTEEPTDDQIRVVLSPLPAPVSAPPPPPPPPPPLPPTAAVPKRRVMTRSRTSKLSKIGKELPPITLDDIKKVKLKSAVVRRDLEDISNKENSGGFVVSMADLKTVNLRKTKGNSLAVAGRRKSFHCSKDLDHSPPEFRRMKLRRLNQSRSPGGTITRNRSVLEEYGQGPTPMLTRALRRKFQTACPISPLGSTSPSPVTSPLNMAQSSSSFASSPSSLNCSHSLFGNPS